ncbi:MAG: prephenate dehydrogenase/arogenate dehydrogenase family protein [Spirochaetota bacterium]|nr:prephenate dehydrogenase/arogenate dehydrogenase family protein [Spirochaetota bacterium]
MSEKNRVGVYGLGRFGLFWATRLAEKGFEVVGCSRRTVELPPNVRQVSVEEVLDSPTVFYCVSISAFEEVLANSLPYLKEGAVVMDTCSVKLYPARVMKRLLPPTIQAIATHPMFGPDSGKDGLEGLPFVMDNVSAHEETWRWWVDEFTSWKMDVLMMSCDQHDREAAWSQGITHFIGLL